jgi:PASTA domain
VGHFRRTTGITVRIVGCAALLTAAGVAGSAEAQAQVRDLRGCSGAVAISYLKQENVPFDIVGDESMVVVGQDGDASHVTLVFDQGGFDDVGPSLPDCSLVTVPGVVGLDVDDAVDSLVEAGLTPEGGDTGTVAEQDPRGRSIAERGSTVSLVLETGEPAGEAPGDGLPTDAGDGSDEAELPAGASPVPGGDAPAVEDPSGATPTGDDSSANGGPAGADGAEAGQPGGDDPGSETDWGRAAALAGTIGGTVAGAAALLARTRAGRHRRTATGRAGDQPRRPQPTPRVRLVPHDRSQAVAAPDGGSLVSVTASLDGADQVVRIEEGVSS